MIRRIRNFLTGSLFRRMYLLYALIILGSIVLLSFLLAGSMADLIVEQTMAYNAQQLSSLHNAFQAQAATLTYLQEKIYDVKTGSQTSLYDSIRLVLKDDKPFHNHEDYDAFIYHADLIHTFFNLVQSSLQAEMSLFQINSVNENHVNMNILWPVQNIGMMQYASEINELISHRSSTQSRGMISFVSARGRPFQRNFYVLYDDIYDADDKSQTIGYLINGYDTSNLDAILRSFSYPLEGAAYILSDRGEVLYDSDGRLNGQVPDFFEALLSRTETPFRQDGFIHNVVYNDVHQFYVVGRMDERALSAKATSSNQAILLMGGAFAAIALLLTLLSTRSLTRQVRGITHVMEEAETGSLTVRASVTGSGDELDQIGLGLNRMIEKIDEHIQGEYISELQRTNAMIRQREAELFALQSQVNPHFLYNTLEVIRMRAITNGDTDTALLIRWLASLFRRRTHTGTVVTVRDELDYCNALMEILRAKFSGEIDVVIDMPDEILDYAILKDLIQPPLENAFIHGFRTISDDDRRLTIQGTLQDGVITLRIHNNGLPIPSETLDGIRTQLASNISLKPQAEHHVGLVNVHRRIRLAYGTPYGMQLESSEEQGTTVTLTIQALDIEALHQRITRSHPQ